MSPYYKLHMELQSYFEPSIFQCQQKLLLPGDSKSPFYPLVVGHLTIVKGHLTIPKKNCQVTDHSFPPPKTNMDTQNSHMAH